MGAGAGLGVLEVESRSGSPMGLVRGSYWAFSGWSWVGIRDTSEGSGQLLIKPWTSGADCPEVIIHPPGWSLEMTIWWRQVWLTAGWLPGLFIVNKGLFPGRAAAGCWSKFYFYICSGCCPFVYLVSLCVWKTSDSECDWTDSWDWHSVFLNRVFLKKIPKYYLN